MNPPADLARVFFLQLSVIGSTMGTRDELDALMHLCESEMLAPLVDKTYALADTRSALEYLHSGRAFGKVVVTTV